MDKGEKDLVKVVRVAHRHRLHQIPFAGFHWVLYITESVNHSGSNNAFIQFVTYTDALSSIHMHKYP